MEAALRKRSRGFVVEFAGLPGSGKSTLAHELADRLRGGPAAVHEPTWELNHRAARWRRVATKVGCILHCVTRHPVGSALTAFAIVCSRQRSVRDLFNTTLNMFYISGLRERWATRPGIHVFDQGVVQQVWSIRFSAHGAVPLEGLGPLGRACYRENGGGVVFVDVKPTTIMERLATRHGSASRLERRISLENRSTELGVAEDALGVAHRAVEALAGPGRLATVGVTNEDGEDIEVTAARLADTVRAWTGAGESGGGDGG